jgi:signal transduction histidine kinase
MSHELRTPLNSIIGFTGIMLQGMVGELTEEQRKQLTIVKKNSDHLLELITDVIDVSRIEANQIKLDIKKFDLADMMRDVRDSFKIATDEKDLKLIMKVPEELTVESDKRRMKQILMNFVSNAVKFTDKGTIQMHVVERDGVVEVSVKDTGIGIRKEDLNMLFKQFSRIHEEGRQIEKGTGLGLYVSKKVSDLIGGKVKVESTYGVGSEFTFTFPLRYGKAMR